MGHASLSTNLRSLECLRAVIVTGSATGAARQLGLTQPAVSRLLGVLERSIGFQLFERRKGRLVPTEEARTLCQEVDIALQSIDRVAQLARNLRNADFGELSIVSPPNRGPTSPTRSAGSSGSDSTIPIRPSTRRCTARSGRFRRASPKACCRR